MSSGDATDSQPTHRSRAFVISYGAAQAGAYISFIPLLTLLLPQKAEWLGGADKAVLLAQVAMVGGLMAAASNLIVGMLSDRTRSRFGRRRPWIIVGIVLLSLSLFFVARAASVPQLMVAIVLFQIAVNMVYSPLTALVPDMVPDQQKGLISAWAGAALPLSTLFTAAVVARLTGAAEWQFAAVAIVSTLLILPFALRLREPKAFKMPEPLKISVGALSDRNFAFAFGSRLFAEGAVALHTLYLFYLIQTLPPAALPRGWSAAEAFGVLLTMATLSATASGFIAGALSDRIKRRRPLVIAGCVIMAAALAVMASQQAWWWVVGAQLVFGVGHGLHAPTVAAMTAEILPDSSQSGRDLGIMNVAVALPQFIGPAIAAALLSAGHPLSQVFLVAAAAGVASAFLLMPMRLKEGLRPNA